MSVEADAPLPALQDRVRSGALWSAGSTLFLRFGNIAIMAVVARIVAPEAFGVFALAMVVQGVVVSLAELGISSALLRTDLDPDTIAPTIATVSIITGVSLGALMAGFADPLAAALGSPEAAGPLRVMAISVALIGPFAVPSAQIQREFRQDVIFRAAAVSFLPSSAILLLVAMAGDGAMAFAWSRVAAQLVSGLILTAKAGTRYRPGFRRDQIRMLIGFGLPLAFANLLSQVLLNVDYLFVGRYLGIEATGLYSMAFTIAGWSTAVISSVLNGIVQPAFSRVRHEGGNLAGALHQATRTVALVAFVIAALTLSLAGPLISTIYGAQWTAAAPALVTLAGYSAVFVVCLLLANIIISTGKTGRLFSVQVIALLALLPAMAVGVQYGGLVGVGIAHIVVTAGVTFPLYAWILTKTVPRSFRVILGAAAWPAFAAVAAGAAAWAVSLLFSVVAVKFVAGGLVGGLVYLVVAAPLFIPLVPPSLVRSRSVGAVLTQAARPAAWVARRVERASSW